MQTVSFLVYEMLLTFVDVQKDCTKCRTSSKARGGAGKGYPPAKSALRPMRLQLIENQAQQNGQVVRGLAQPQRTHSCDPN